MMLVTRGVIYFSKQMEPRIVDITHEDKQTIVRDIEHIRNMIASEEVPRQNPSRCGYCEVKKYCSP